MKQLLTMTRRGFLGLVTALATTLVIPFKAVDALGARQRMTSDFTKWPGHALRNWRGHRLVISNPPHGWMFVNDSPEVRALAIPKTDAELAAAQNGQYACIRVEMKPEGA